MGLLPCLDMLDLIRFCLLTLPCKLMVGTSFSLINNKKLAVCQLNLAINHRGRTDLAVKTPRGDRVSP
jgi:hypothetical protein